MSIQTSHKAGDRLIRAFLHRVLGGVPPYRMRARAIDAPADRQQLVDFVFSLPGDPQNPRDAFDRLRWGGQFVMLATDPRQVETAARKFDPTTGFAVEQKEGIFRRGLPLFSTRFHYLVARKVDLIPPGEITHRFTFSVRLVQNRNGRSTSPGAIPGSDPSTGSGYVVRKQVPTYSSIFKRLREKFPDADSDVLVSRTHRLVDRVFPVFLSREAAFLQLLQRDLPPRYKLRVPRVLGVEKGDDGLVRKLYLNWLRMGCEPLPHLEFARQSADLLHALHDIVGVIHLDLRLDNFVITDKGVGFVDFGSAVRVGENLAESPLLRSLFDGMISTSKVQRALGKMKRSGKVTSSYIAGAHKKIDKAIDLFYLAVQMKKPLSNPDFHGLVDYDPTSEVYRQLSTLATAILRPKNPDDCRYVSASDVLRGLEKIEQKVHAKSNGG